MTGTNRDRDCRSQMQGPAEASGNGEEVLTSEPGLSCRTATTVGKKSDMLRAPECKHFAPSGSKGCPLHAGELGLCAHPHPHKCVRVALCPCQAFCLQVHMCHQGAAFTEAGHPSCTSFPLPHLGAQMSPCHEQAYPPLRVLTAWHPTFGTAT